MPWKFVCDLWYHKVLQTNFMKPKVADTFPWH